MRVQNEKVIRAWLDGRKATSGIRDIADGYYMRKGASISTDGEKLYSYWTPIAWYEGETLVVDMRRYSNTTTRQQSDLRYILSESGIEYKEITE